MSVPALIFPHAIVRDDKSQPTGMSSRSEKRGKSDRKISGRGLGGQLSCKPFKSGNDLRKIISEAAVLISLFFILFQALADSLDVSVPLAFFFGQRFNLGD